MHELMKTKFAIQASDVPNIDNSADASEFVFPNPVIIKRVGLIVTTAVVTDNSVACTFQLSRRPVAGSASNAVGLGTFNAIAAGVDPAAGSVIWADCNVIDSDGETAEDGTTRYEAPNANITAPESRKNPWLILPGQSFAWTLDTNAHGDSGVVRGFVEYIDVPFTDGYVDQANITQRTVTAAA